MRRWVAVVSFFASTVVPAFGQPPTVQTVLNIASADARLSNGLIVVMTGTGFTRAMTVTVAGQSVGAFLFIDDKTVTYQLPVGMSPGSKSLTATTNSGTATAIINTQAYAPGLLPRGMGGLFPNQGGILHSDGTPVSDQKPAGPGESLVAQCVGLGLTSPIIGTGSPAPTPGPTTQNIPRITVGGTVAEVTSSILAPALVGLYYVTFKVPAGTSPGSKAVVLTVGAGAAGVFDSNALNLPVAAASVPSSVSGILPAASYQSAAVAPDSFAAIFGSNLAAALTVAQVSPLPEVLGDIEVIVRDSAGTERKAGLHFVAPTQINFLVPAQTALGQATVRILRRGQTLVSTALSVEPIAPGIFTLNGAGTGTPNAALTRVRQSGEQVYELVFDCSSGTCQARPIALSDKSETVVLVLYGTGLSKAASVTAAIGGIDAKVLYAGPQGMQGLDQVNVVIPPEVDGKGLVDVQVTADGKPANPVWIRIPSTTPLPDPISWDFSTSAEGWTAQNATLRVQDGFLILDPLREDPQARGPVISVKAEEYPYLKVRMSVACEGRAQIYFMTAGDTLYSGDRLVSFDPQVCLLCDNPPLRLYTIRMSGHPQWKAGTVITNIRVDPCGPAPGRPDSDKDLAKMDYVRLSPVP